MDVDPLADTGPPRYIIESDEEEDEYNPLRPSIKEQEQVANVEIIGDLPKGKALIIATGDISKYWSRNADLEEQQGAIYVNNIQVGLVFKPSWTQAIVVVSEILTRLPVWTMSGYASTTLRRLEPTRVVLLDTYSATTYISEQGFTSNDAPIRYMATSSVDDWMKRHVQPFSPPNLLHSTSAAFLSCIETGHPEAPGFAILVPSPHMPHPAPKSFHSSNILELSEDHNEWPEVTVNAAQDLIFQLAQQHIPGKWVNTKRDGSVQKPIRPDEIGEGGMYI